MLCDINIAGPGNYFAPYDGNPILDSWGNPLDISYERTSRTDTVFVCSAGPDCKMSTEDDISYGRMNCLTDMIILNETLISN